MEKNFFPHCKFALATSIALGLALSYQVTAQAATDAPPLATEASQIGSQVSSAPLTEGAAFEDTQAEAPLAEPRKEEPGLEQPQALAPHETATNVVEGARITQQTVPNTGHEDSQNMLNGTQEGLADKWHTPENQARVDIQLPQAKRVVRWVVEHAESAGESRDLNTRDFDLLVKDMKTQTWQVAKRVRGNQAAVTDLLLDQPIESDEWGLSILQGNSSRERTGIRIYNWKMYEVANPATPALPSSQVKADAIGDGYAQVDFGTVAAHTTVTLYDSAQSQQILASVTTQEAGPVQLNPVKVGLKTGTLYYRVQAPGLAQSQLGQVTLPHRKREQVALLTLNAEKAKRIYQVGEALDVTGTDLHVQFVGDVTGLHVDLGHAAVSIQGYDPNRIGQQDLEVSYLGHKVRLPWKVFVYQAQPNVKRQVVGLDITAMPQYEYLQGEDLHLVHGRFRLVYSSGATLLQPFINRNVVYTGYDKNKLGRQTVTMTYRGHIVSHFEVNVTPKPVIDFTRLRRIVQQAETLQQGVEYQYSHFGKKAALNMALQRARETLASEFVRKNQEEAAYYTLYGAIRGLNGRANQAGVLADFKQMIARGEAALLQHPQVAFHQSLAQAVQAAKDLLVLSFIPSKELGDAYNLIDHFLKQL